METLNTRQFEERKREHLQHALDPSHQASGLSGLGNVHLFHDALPELDLEEISIESLRLGKKSPTPFFVAGMTAGHADAPRLNLLLAQACERRGWAMGVGSQRRELQSPDVDSDRWSELRRAAPCVTLFANLGITQLIAAKTDAVRRLVDALGAQALVIHANALQEAMQPEGTPQFRGAAKRLSALCAELDVPVVLKETGCGFSVPTLARLRETGLAAIDVSGLGGTHWGRIEGARAPTGSIHAEAARTFAEWGEPTVDSVVAARSELPASVEVWASGGVRTGLDAAKLIALGAEQVGFAQPALAAALGGEESLARWMEAREHELRVAQLCTGSARLSGLRGGKAVWKKSAN